MNRRSFLKTLGAAGLAMGLPSCNRTQSRPNILFCIADDASYPHMGAYGCDWVATPAFDFVASQGVLFTRAYTPNAKCAPSRACILTGRNSWQLEEAANHWCFFPQKFVTYAEAMTGHGYHVGSTAKGWAPGVALDEHGKRRQMTGVKYDAIKTTPPAEHISNIDYAANFTAFLDDKPEGAPFCFWYGGFEPHRAYEYGAGINKGGKQTGDIDRVYPFWPDNDTVRTDMLDYAYEIEYFDRHLGQMLDVLKQRGELDNTLVIVTADNGMPFPRIKSQAYDQSIHLPFAAMWPRGIVNPGRTVDDFVSFIDLAPTFLELAGLTAASAGMQPMQGKSMTDIFYQARESYPGRDHVLIGKERHDVGRPQDVGYPIRGIVTKDYLYLHNFSADRWPSGNPETGYLACDGSPTKTEVLDTFNNPATRQKWQMNFAKHPQHELYDLRQDPDCMHNLAEDSAYAEIRAELAAQLVAELKAQKDPRMYGKGDVFDHYRYADSSSVNFYERYMGDRPVNWGWVNRSDFRPEQNMTR